MVMQEACILNMGTKMAVAFSNIFMNKVETEILSQSLFKHLKTLIDDIFSLVRLTEVRKSARGTLRYARGILVYGVTGIETFFFKIRSLFVDFHKTKKVYNQIK